MIGAQVMIQFSTWNHWSARTAYEILRCLVGSEMCIRDSVGDGLGQQRLAGAGRAVEHDALRDLGAQLGDCLLYTSDAADEL